MRSRSPLFGLALGLVCAAFFACSDSSAPPAPSSGSAARPAAKPVEKKPEPAEPMDPASLVKRGRSVYNANCIACHSSTPSLDGALGPALAGSSRELIEARVVRGVYPEGYTPKRDTRAMVALPHLEPEIDALAAYLAE